MSGASRTVSLVLGSGGARGHAHIGVIRALDEYGFKVHNIAGTSMGAAIGGIYAAGELDTYIDWAYQLDKKAVFKLLDFSFSWRSIFKGERIIKVLRELVGDRQIEDLDKRFTAVATSLDEQREVWLNSGSLFDAIHASTAVPGIFAPVVRGSQILVDGGLVNPIPIAPTLNDSTDLTIAVNLNSIDDSYTPPAREPATEVSDNAYRSRIANFLAELVDSDDDPDSSPASDASVVLAKSIDVMQGAIARLKLAAYAPDKTISIPRDACTFFEFDRAEEMADLGYDRARKALQDLNEGTE